MRVFSSSVAVLSGCVGDKRIRKCPLGAATPPELCGFSAPAAPQPGGEAWSSMEATRVMVRVVALMVFGLPESCDSVNDG